MNTPAQHPSPPQHHTPAKAGRCAVPLTLLLLLALCAPSPHAAAQRPCNDTTVLILDSICEGDTLYYRGRALDHSGIYYDTIPRTDTICDSIIILKLTLLDIPYINIIDRKHCKTIIGHDLLGGYPLVTHYHWTADPPDSTLEGQEWRSWVRVNPRTPTTYTLQLDYRASPPQCPGTSSISIIPIEPVAAAMHVSPDEITYDNMHIIAEDFSTGTREAHWGGWAGRNWYINGVKQKPNNEWVEFYGTPDWGDTVHLLMEAFTPTCLDTASKDIPFRQVAIYIPNAFTPDAESNNLITPLTFGILEYDFWIFDRRGTLIFHSATGGTGWDGTTADGRRCQQGTYSYLFRYRDTITPAGFKSQTGTITLLR